MLKVQIRTFKVVIHQIFEWKICKKYIKFLEEIVEMMNKFLGILQHNKLTDSIINIKLIKIFTNDQSKVLIVKNWI